MSTLIPNANCWISFATVYPIAAATLVPKATEIASPGSTDLADFVISITASSTGNTVPTPKLKSLFEPSIAGTSTAAFSSEMYRDSVKANDIAWNMLPRGTSGVFYIARFGGTGAFKLPVLADVVEVWPVLVSSRAGSAMTSNTAQTFSLTCAVPQVPNESAVVAA